VRIRGASFSESIPLEGWTMASSTAARPEDLPADLVWLPIEEPMPVAAALRAHGQWKLDGAPRVLDAETFWYRGRIPRRDAAPFARSILRLDGLATVADVWVDGHHVLRSESMFHEHRIDLGTVFATVARTSGTFPSGQSPRGVEAGTHEVCLRFAPLAEALAAKRPRPRWKTRLVSHQGLRFLRTSLVGRMPGWSPPVAPVGPWRPISIERSVGLVVEDVDLRTKLEGGSGIVRVILRGMSRVEGGASGITDAVLSVGGFEAPLERRSGAAEGEVFLLGAVSVPDAKPWWPHTHGAPCRYPVEIRLRIGGEAATIDIGGVGFRDIKLDKGPDGRGFSLVVNGVPVFVRGASWTTLDVTRLGGRPSEYLTVLDRVRRAGMNMIRLSGTMFYETDDFYDLCDELGIMVWQDFMFANMDYPVDDDAFRISVTREAKDILGRLQARPCLAVLCGGSEVEQQAAMFGLPSELWRSPLFHEVLPEACAAHCPDVPYWPNTPCGGAMPFHTDEGTAHYYGVGAYLRPLEDARQAQVRFAAECLTFANVPEEDLFSAFLPPGEAPVVSARWKERAPSDHGAGWDFDDVRDHYVRLLFGVDPTKLRYYDMDRYLALARVATGEVMARTMGEFRRKGSTASGALVWFLQDLWPGAGWGILDSRGRPKSAYWFLKRALSPLAVWITDEGLNGLGLHAANETDEHISGALTLSLYQGGEVLTLSGMGEVTLPPRSSVRMSGDAVINSFTDLSRAYRFGPPGHDVAVVKLLDSEGEVAAQATRLLDFGAPPPCRGLEGSLVYEEGRGRFAVAVRTTSFAHAVHIVVRDYLPADDYFDLAPGQERTIALEPVVPAPRPPSGELSALNLATPLTLTRS
jgi:beta-mannosidase